MVCFKVQHLSSFLKLSSVQFHIVLLTPLSSEGLRRQILAGERPSANALSLKIQSNNFCITRCSVPHPTRRYILIPIPSNPSTFRTTVLKQLRDRRQMFSLQKSNQITFSIVRCSVPRPSRRSIPSHPIHPLML